jgi:hypothetical protein
MPVSPSPEIFQAYLLKGFTYSRTSHFQLFTLSHISYQFNYTQFATLGFILNTHTSKILLAKISRILNSKLLFLLKTCDFSYNLNMIFCGTLDEDEDVEAGFGIHIT